MTVYSLAVERVKNFSKNFPNLKVGVPIAEMIGQKGGTLLRVSLCILHILHKMSRLEPTRFIKKIYQ